MPQYIILTVLFFGITTQALSLCRNNIACTISYFLGFLLLLLWRIMCCLLVLSEVVIFKVVRERSFKWQPITAGNSPGQYPVQILLKKNYFLSFTCLDHLGGCELYIN